MEPPQQETIALRCPKCRKLIYGERALVEQYQRETGTCPKCGTDLGSVKPESVILQQTR